MGGNSKKSRSQPGKASKSAAPSEQALEMSVVALIADLKSLVTGSAAACLKGPILVSVCSSTAATIAAARTAQPGIYKPTELLEAILNMLKLAVKLLAARKRARDWKQQDYSSRVCSVLAAATAAVEFAFDSYKREPFNIAAFTMQIKQSDVLNSLQSAHVEVGQLLQSYLQQRQQQQQRHQQLPKEVAEQLPQLQHVAFELLSCWLAAHAVWVSGEQYASASTNTEVLGGVGMQEAAVEIAAVLAQTLTADSPPQHFQVVAQVVYMIYRFPNYTKSPKYGIAYKTFRVHPQLLLLASIMLLVHSHSAQQCAAVAYSSSSSGSGGSSSSGGSSGGADGSTGSDTGGAVCAGAGSSNGSASKTDDAEQQQQQQQQLADLTLQMWQQLGMLPEALQPFVAAVEQLLRSSSLLSDCSRDAFSTLACYLFMQGMTAAQKTAALELSRQLQGAFIQTQQLVVGIWSMVRPDIVDIGMLTRVTISFDQLSRQRQQLLQWIVWQLPLLLLLQQQQQIAGMLGLEGVAQLHKAAADAATTLTLCWSMEGLTTAPTAAAAVGQQRRPQADLLPSLLDGFLQLLQQQLLQKPGGLLLRPAAAAAAAAAAARTAAMDAVTDMLRFLQAAANVKLTPAEQRQVWGGRMPAVMLVLEVIVRGFCLQDMLSAEHSDSSSGGGADQQQQQQQQRRLTAAGKALRLQLAACFEPTNNLHSCACLFELTFASIWPMYQERPSLQQQQQHHWEWLSPQQQQLLSLSASLLKAYRMQQPPVKAVPAVTRFISAAVNAARAACLITQSEVPDAVPSEAVLGAWYRAGMAPCLAWLGRCFLAAASILDAWARSGYQPDGNLALQLQVALGLINEVSAARAALVTLRTPWQLRHSSSSSSSSSGSGAGGSSGYGQQQGHVAAAAASAPAYGSLTTVFAAVSATGSFQDEIARAHTLVEAASQRVSYLEADSSGSSSGGSDQGSDSLNSEDDDNDDVIDDQVSYLNSQLKVIESTTAPTVMWASVSNCFTWTGRELRAVGLLLCDQLPVPWCCNNPDCTNMAGASELQLVGGKGCVCGGCKVARYCSRSCQAAHWQQHRDICVQLVAAEPAAPAVQQQH